MDRLGQRDIPDAPIPLAIETSHVLLVARAQQDAVWDRDQAGNELRSHLREYHPAFLAAGTASLGLLRRTLVQAG